MLRRPHRRTIGHRRVATASLVPRVACLAALLALVAPMVASAAGVRQEPLAGDSPVEGLFVSKGTVQPIEPGTTIRVPIRLRNTSARPLRIRPVAIPGRGADDDGSLVDVDPAAGSDPNRNATRWVRFPFETLALQARSAATFDVTVRAPRTARPGAHAVLLTFNVPTTAASSGPGVSGVGGAASTLVLRVAGATTPDLRLSGVSGPRVVWSGDAPTFRARVTNEGDTALDLDAQVQLRTFWGSSGRLLRADSQLVLPGGRRTFELTYSDPPLFGRFAPRVTVVGGEGSDLRVSRELPAVWVLPPWWFVIALLAALALPVWVWRRSRRDVARRDARHQARVARARERVERRRDVADAKRRAAEDRRRR